MDRLRIGLAGAGVIGGTHSAVLQQIAARWPDRVELTAVADPLPARAAETAGLYGYRQVFADARCLLDAARVNVLFVCTPTRHHARLVCEAAAAGVHVFCEKPLAMSSAEGETMLGAVRRAGVRCQIGLVLRFAAVYTVMASLARAPEMEEPIAVIFRDDQCFPVRGFHGSGWRGDRHLTAGGTLIEHGVHDLDLLVSMFGGVRRVRAWQENRAGRPGVEDYVATELEFASGLRAQLVTIWHDMVQRVSNRRLEIFCRRGFVASDHDMLGDITVQQGDGDARVLPAAEVERRFAALLGRADDTFRDWYGVAYFVQDLAFVEALLADRDPQPDLAVGLAAQRLAEAVYESAARGGDVELDAPAP
jgi:predicted dehydrogenase